MLFSLLQLRLCLLLFIAEAMGGCWLVEQPAQSMLRYHPRVIEVFSLLRVLWPHDLRPLKLSSLVQSKGSKDVQSSVQWQGLYGLFFDGKHWAFDLSKLLPA